MPAKSMPLAVPASRHRHRPRYGGFHPHAAVGQQPADA
jgi:hypothetical protein